MIPTYFSNLPPPEKPQITIFPHSCYPRLRSSASPATFPLSSAVLSAPAELPSHSSAAVTGFPQHCALVTIGEQGTRRTSLCPD